MAQIAVEAGQKFFDTATGKEFTAGAIQDIGGGKQGQFISSAFSLTKPTSPTQTTSAFSSLPSNFNTPVEFDASNFGSPTLSVPQGTDQQDSTDLNAFVQSVGNLFGVQPGETRRLAQEESRLTGELEGALDKSSTRGARQLEEERKAGVPELSTQLADIEAEALQIQAQILQEQEQAERLGTPRSLITVQQNEARRKRAVELGALSLRSLATQGKLNAARGIANRVIDLEFADVQNQIDSTLQLLQINESKFTRAEAKQAKVVTAALQERSRILQEQKEERQANVDLMLGIAKGGGDPALIDFSRSVEENINTAAPFLRASNALSLKDTITLATNLVDKNIAKDFSEAVRMVSAITDGDLSLLDEPSTIDLEMRGTAGQIAEAIKTIESNGNYQARGASGEFGAYQFMPGTWAGWSQEYLRATGQDVNQSLAQTPSNQDAVANFKIQQWLDRGLTAAQIFSSWNSGSTEWEGKIGVNSKGVAYNVPAYVNKGLNVLGEITGESLSGRTREALDSAFDFLSVGFTSDQAKRLPATFENAKEQGEEQAKDFILTTALNSLPVDQRNRAVGRAEGIAALQDINKLLNDFQAAGGDTGFFTGTIEDINRRIGQTQNPNLVFLATQMRQAIQDYRRAVSGAAFTESESKEYERIFPSIGNVPEVNQAIIQSLVGTFRRNQKTTLQLLVGTQNFESLFADELAFEVDLPNLSLPQTNQSTTAELQSMSNEDLINQIP